MDMDPDIANWVLEFLLQQPLQDQTLKSLLRAVPPPNNNPNLKKSLLLNKLEADMCRNSVTDATLDLLEQLEETELVLGNETISDRMKHALCAVAVECTVKHLKCGNDEEEDEDKGKRKEFLEAVKNIWRGKVDVEKGAVGSEALWAWKDEIEVALWDDDACNRVVKKSQGINGVEAVNAYIREEREKMEPSFLELLAERMKTDEILQGIMGVNGVSGESNANEVVKEPLPDALKIAETISDEARKHPVEDNQATNASKPSLMERNSTAHTCEWDESIDSEESISESIDGSQEGRANRGMARLPSPRRINTTPLNKHQIVNVKTRRKPLKWSLLEEDTLRTEVHRVGKGNWKAILNLHRDIFEGRTEGDLKDKWRNMTC